jgi:hypothetical protein
LIQWIPSDPRAYITVARVVNERNADFRKATKFTKHWKCESAKVNEDFKLKSFHVEQALTT